MPLHAIDITLTRAVDEVKPKATRQFSGTPIASPQDGKNIAVLVSARNEKRAIKKVWRRLGGPLDVLCGLFPGRKSMLKMSVPFTPGVKRRIHAWTKGTGTSGRSF